MSIQPPILPPTSLPSGVTASDNFEFDFKPKDKALNNKKDIEEATTNTTQSPEKKDKDKKKKDKKDKKDKKKEKKAREKEEKREKRKE
jgi:hypothetical protein